MLPRTTSPADKRASACGAPSRLYGVDECSQQAFNSFLSLVRLHRQVFMKMAAACGTHPGQIICLRLLAEEGGLTQRDLALRMNLSRPTISRMLRGMENGGVVERMPDPDDRRLARVTLTAKGRRLERSLRGIAADYVKRTFGSLSETDRAVLVRLLDDLAAEVAAYDPPAARGPRGSSRERHARRRGERAASP